MYSLGCYLYSDLLLLKQHLTFLEFAVFYCHSSTVFHRKIYGHLLQCITAVHSKGQTLSEIPCTKKCSNSLQDDYKTDLFLIID